MRPTVYGKEILFNLQGELIGINLGFNFFCEHEGGTQELVQSVNLHAFPDGCTPVQYRKYAKAVEKAAKRWERTPFAGYVFAPSAQIFTRKIIIDNSDVPANFPVRQLRDGKYIMFALNGSVYSAPSYYSQCLGNAHKFSEDKLFPMRDYNPSRKTFMKGEFAASWASGGFMLLLSEEMADPAEGIIRSLTEALMRNTLACVPNHPLFRNRGCILVVLDKAPAGINPLNERRYSFD